MKIESAGATPAFLGSGAAPKPPVDTRQTATDFEALLIGQMLKSARADCQGWFGTGEDTSSASLIEMAEEQIAKVLAQSGGLGLHSIIEKPLANAKAAAAASPQEGSSTMQMSGKLR
jgi:Rod binding domain-containing protein